jgi:ADP-ribose pyrophosphatase YjhB (NUDIX family)/predicted house-cleaning noncanonical NTP pyrophosphatase (MazG superfamily)
LSATDYEYLEHLLHKVTEEAAEITAASTDLELAAEIGDLYEVLAAVIKLKGLDPAAIAAHQTKKRADRGGFEQRLLLETGTPPLPPPIKVGCEAYIVRDGQVLLGLRHKVKAGAGMWALPGGHMQPFERADATVIREVKEETGITVSPADVTFLAFVDGPNPEAPSHYLHATFRVDIGAAEPIVAEPDACSEWRWFPEDNLPDNLFSPHADIIATIRTGHPYRPAQ